MDGLHIRRFEEGDRPALRAICLETSRDSFLRDNPEVLYLLYLDYYLDNCPDCCFVCADSAGRALGYVLCAPDGKRYIREQKELCLPKLTELSPASARQKKLALIMDGFLTKKYPAHLHIDLDESVRRRGVGGRLMAALFRELRLRGVRGLRLCCAADNAPAMAFYQKQGFRRLFVVGGGAFFGIEL